jgi:hypothetical protein
MLLRCERNNCQTFWNYKGSQKYATCPKCYGKVKVELAIVKPDQIDKLVPEVSNMSLGLDLAIDSWNWMASDMESDQVQWLAYYANVVFEGKKKFETLFKDEDEAYPRIRMEIENAKEFITIIGIANTSILDLYEDYKKALLNGKSIFVWMFSVKEAEKADSWPMQSTNFVQELVKPAKIKYHNRFQKKGAFHGKLFSRSSLSGLIADTTLLWNQMEDEAKKETRALGKRNLGEVKIENYTGRPTVKLWLFDGLRAVWGEYRYWSPEKGRVSALVYTDTSQRIADLTPGLGLKLWLKPEGKKENGGSV